MVGSEKTVKKTFLSGVLLLTLSTVLVKIVGLFYKIPMLSYLGAVGMGYFNSAYEIYALFCVISTAGLPVALSVLISAALAKGKNTDVQRIFRASMLIFVIIGAAGTAVMIFFAPFFCQIIKSENAYGCILAISPTVFFVCISSALRGYFQGYQKMLPTAVSQLLEAIGKLAFGLLLAKWALERGYDTSTVAAAAGLGLTLGTLLSLIYLIFEKLRFRSIKDRNERHENAENVGKYREIWKSLAKLSIPMTLGASAVSLTKLIDMTMILRRLQAIGYTELAANDAYGSYTTLALSVFGLLPTLVNSIALPLVPMLSSAIAEGNRDRQTQMIRSSYQLTALFAIPAALGISAFARPTLLLLFGNEPQAVAVAAPLLSMLGVSVFLSCMITATNSVLHAYQSVNRPVLSMLAGAVVKVVFAYLLIGNEKIGLYGAPISTLLCNLTVVALNLWFASSLCKVEKLSTVFWRPFSAAIASTGISYALYLFLVLRFGEHVFFSAGGIFLTCILYLLFACLFGALGAEDLLSMPMGTKFCGILLRLGLLREKKENKIEREQ